MGRRGRPPHPDILTPREWEVLALLREGLTNEAIAARLGVTHAAAKFHVSQILSKLSVATREEAAAWQPEAERRPWWAAALAWLRPVTLGKAALIGAAVAVLVGLGVLAWGVMRDSGEEPAPVVGASPTATRQPTAAPSPSEPPPTPVVTGDPASVFNDLPGPMEEVPVPLTGVPTMLVGGLYRASSDGATLSRIAGPTDPADGAHVAFSVFDLSPDGRWLAFVRRAPFNYPTGVPETIYVRDLSAPGAPARPVASFGKVWHVAISPDGSRLIVNGSILPPDWGALAPGDHFLIDLKSSTANKPEVLQGAVGVDWSPDGQWLAFGRATQEGGYATFVSDATGQNARSLTEEEDRFAWSPDGAHLAVWDCCQDSGVVLAGIDGSRRQLTNLTPHMASGVSWSWGGSALSFSRYDGTSGKFMVTVVNVSSGDSHDVGPGTASGWSLDGQRLAVVDEGRLDVVELATGERHGLISMSQPFAASPSWLQSDASVFFHYAPAFLSSVSVIDPVDGSARHLAYGDEPEWSPDGRLIAFIGRVNSGGLAGQSEVWAMSAWGGVPRRLGTYGWTDVVGACSYHIAWSTDSNWVYYAFPSGAGGGPMAIPVDGSHSPEPGGPGCDQYWSPTGDAYVEHVSNVTPPWMVVRASDGLEVREIAGSNPVWSRDGRWLAYFSEGGIYITGYPSGEPHRIITLPVAGPFSPNFTLSPAGDRIAYTDAERYDTRRLYVVPVDGSAPVCEVGPGGNPDWSPDGTRLAFESGTAIGDLWIAVVQADCAEPATRLVRGERPRWSPDGTAILAVR